MKYKTKLVFLCSLATALSLILAGTFIFDPEELDARSSLYTWLDEKWADQADRIVLAGTGLASGKTELVRRNNEWFVLANDREYPAKQERVRGLFEMLSAKAPYPVRAKSESSHEKLGVTEQAASRISIYGGASRIPLLDLLIGSGNASGSEIYLRENGKKEVRSGEDLFTLYSDAKQSAWFNLELFGGGPGTISSRMVQRFTVSLPGGAGYTLARQSDGGVQGWKAESSPGLVLDSGKVESYLRNLLDTAAADFAVGADPAAFNFNQEKMELILDDLSVKTLAAAPSENGFYPVGLSGKSYVYLLSPGTMERIFRDLDYFKQ